MSFLLDQRTVKTLVRPAENTAMATAERDKQQTLLGLFPDTVPARLGSTRLSCVSTSDRTWYWVLPLPLRF